MDEDQLDHAYAPDAEDAREQTPRYYELFSLPPAATAAEILDRWKTLSRLHHPDAGGNDHTFRLLSEAYQVLRDPSRRAKYTEEFYLSYGRCPKCNGSGTTYKQVSFSNRLPAICRECGGLGSAR